MRGSRRAISWNELSEALKERLRMSSPEIAPDKQRSTKQKYHAVSVVDTYGILYDSKTERDWAYRLDIKVNLGQIKRWSYSPRFLIQGPTADNPDLPRITYRPDYMIWNNDGSWWVLDAKGAVTREAKRIGKLWKRLHPNHPLYFGFKDGSMKEAA